jgi:hypothetical protein
MTIRLLAVSACVLALIPAEGAAQSVGGGIKGGLSLGDVPEVGNVLDVEGFDTSLRTGFAVGGFLTWRFESGFAIQPEVLYTQKGVKLTFDTEFFDAVDGEVEADFVDVPVLARYTFGQGGTRGYVFAGPSFDFKVNAKAKASAMGVSEEEDLDDQVEGFEFALVFGGGVEFGPVLLEARWSEGLTNLAKEPEGDASDVKTRTFLILGGVRF